MPRVDKTTNPKSQTDNDKSPVRAGKLCEVPQGLGLLFVLIGLMFASVAHANDLEDARKQFSSGDYSGCISALERAMKDGAGGEERYLLLTKALLTVGRYPDALTTITKAMKEEPSSIRLRWQAREVFFSNGLADRAKDVTEEVLQRVGSDPRSYREPSDLVIFAQAALLKNADPKKVLDQVLGTAIKSDPKFAEAYLVSGNLALEKHDYALAAKKFEAGLKEIPDDIELKFGLARAYEPSDTAVMVGTLESIVERNTNHIGSLLLLVDHAIDAEDYPEADKLLDHINEINPWHPDAWAYRAVIAHLQNQPELEKLAREKGLKFWKDNPRVDYLVGLKLAQNYRFAEGAEHEKKALEFDPNYLPAKAQLAHDLLRLGDEAEGWDLASEVHQRDGYDVEAYNTMNLRDTMSKFATLTNGDFLVRMGAREAAIYGQRALALLENARSNLCAKYGFEVKRPTIVEIFPEQKDFAVRTFGMPGNPGYLGVCFGSVVTANSPAAHRDHSINWEAVLWHEFCHVVTLQLTKNKMPRWLSEGISVYEESQANPSWGQHMSPRYREMVLGDELTPVSKLSGAFLSPESDLHLQFAYYESSLVVEFIIQRYGLDKLKAILGDLGQGMEINQAIAKNTEPIEKLEAEFTAFAREKAQNLAPSLDFEKPDFAQDRPVPGGRRRGQNRRRRQPVDVQTSTNRVTQVTTNSPSRATNELDLLSSSLPVSRSSTNVLTVHPRTNSIAINQSSSPESFDGWVKSHPSNYWALSYQAEKLVEEKKWPEAKVVLERFVQLFPDCIGAESPYPLLAATYRALGDTNAEKQVLAKLASLDDETPEAYLRLMELGVASANWQGVAENAERYLAVNPLVAVPYRYLLQASELTGKTSEAISACRALLELDPPDPAQTHYKLAKLLYAQGDAGAHRHVLQALEEAPRYRDALQLLVEINNNNRASEPAPAATPTPQPPK